MHDLVIEGRFVNADGVFHGEIGIDNGRITEIRKQGLKGDKRIHVGNGCLAFPGFIDVHVHLRDDGSHAWSYKEDFKTGAKAAIHGGVTTVADMPNTPLPAITAERVREKKRIARAEASGLADILFYGGVTKDNLEEIKRMRDEVVAFKIYLCETTGSLYLERRYLSSALSVIMNVGMPVTIHCENQEMISAGLRENPETEVSAVKYVIDAMNFAHSSFTVTENEEKNGGESGENGKNGEKENKKSTKKSMKLNIAHVSVYETVRLLRSSALRTQVERFERFGSFGRFGRFECEFLCEVTPHHLFFSARNASFKVYPPLRSEENRRNLLNAFKNGDIDILASDHAPHMADESAAGVPNLDTYGCIAGWLIRNGVSPQRISAACSYNPARFLGLNDRGQIKTGMRADFTIIDLKNMRKVRNDVLFTKCGWSPFEGYELPSVKHTILKGEIKSEYDEVFC